MGFTVRVQNFQSIQDAEIRISGFTVLTGTNNTGKSAMMRAIRAVFTNPGGHRFVRHGTEQTSVTLSFDDGNTVLWEKGPKVNRYTVNGKVYNQVGRGYPGIPDAVKDLGVIPLEVGNQTLWPQIAPQISGQTFLVDESGAAFAEAVADAERVGVLSDSLRASERDRKSVAATLKVRREDEIKGKTELDSFTGLASALDSVGSLEAAVEKANKISRALEHLTQLRDRWKSAKGIVSRLEGIQRVQVPSDSLVTDAREALSTLDWALSAKSKHNQYCDAIQRLAGVDSVEIPHKSTVEAATTSLEDLADLQGLRSRLARAKAAVARYEGAQHLAVNVDMSQLEKVFKAVEISTGLRTSLATARVGVEEAEAELSQAQRDLQALEAEAKQVLGDMKECPTCGTVQEHTHEVEDLG